MQIKTFFYNLTKVASQPALSNVTTVEVSKKDMAEIISFLESESVPHTVDNEQDLRFTFQNQNFNVIENDKEEEVGADGKVIEPAKWQAVLSKEEQAVADAQTDPMNNDVLTLAANEPQMAAEIQPEPEAETEETKPKGKGKKQQ